MGNESKNNYAKKIQSMKDETKKKLWEDLMIKYKEYMLDFDELIQYFVNNKRPSCTAKNITEKNLASWLRNQMNNYEKNINCMKDEKKRNLWNDLTTEYKKYILTADEIWYSTYNELITYFDNNKKKLVRNAKDILEKKLHKWIYSQKYNYEKNLQAMCDDTKRNLWDELYVKYKDYMPAKY